MFADCQTLNNSDILTDWSC